jgi:hypothetical protein
MKKGKGKWLPLALMLAAGTVMVACDNSTDDPTPIVPLAPATTLVTFNGEEIYSHVWEVFEDEHGKGHVIDMHWEDAYHGQIGKIAIIWGKDILEDGAGNTILGLVADNPSTISQADYEALKAKLFAALPANHGKNGIFEGVNTNVNVVANYATIIKNAILKLAQAAKANIGRGA